MASDRMRWARARERLWLALRLPELGWAFAAWLILAAVEVAPAISLWDVVLRQSIRVSVQHIACSDALGAWVALAWLSAHQRMSRAPSLAPRWGRLLPPLVAATGLFALLSASLPWLTHALAHGAHAHEAGALEPLAWRETVALLTWTTGAAAFWMRALPQRAVWGGAVLFALAWLVSPHADARALELAAALACASALLWPAQTSAPH